MNVKEFEKKFTEIQKLYESGNITSKEYAALMTALDLQSQITANSKDLQKKQDLYKAMMAAVKLTKTIL